MFYDDYERLIPPAHRYYRGDGTETSRFDPLDDGEERSRFSQFVLLCCKQGIDMGNMIEEYLVDFDLDWASGKQLEFLAAILGVERKLPFNIVGSDGVLTDDDLRLLVRARIAINTWDGTNEGIADILRDVFGQYGFSFTDNQDMSMSYIIRGEFSAVQQQMIKGDLIIPRPCGVAVDYTFLDTVAETAISTDSTIGSDFKNAEMEDSVDPPSS